METELECRIYLGSARIPILNRINLIPRKILSNIAPPHLPLGLPKSLFPVHLNGKIAETLLLFSILSTFPAYLNLLDLIPDYIR